jgi:hypothetical protein
MSNDRVIERIRAADPAPAATLTDHDLFARIVASPGDPRLKSPGKRRPLRMGTRGVALVAAAVVLSASGGAFGAIQLVLSHASPKALFEANPQGQFSRLPGQITQGTGQTVIPSTVRLATTFTVPGMGRFEYWIALSRPKGRLCLAIRQPDGTWADLGKNSLFGGPVPGCGFNWQAGHGFAYYPTTIDAPGRRVWRIVYGYAPTTGHPVQIRDRISGVTAPVADGRYFAIVLPYCHGRGCDRPAPFAYFQLQTLDASGRVLVTDERDPGM